MKILEVSPFKATASGPTTVLKPVIQKLLKKDYSIDVFSTLKFDQDRKRLITDLGADYYSLEQKLMPGYRKLTEVIPNIDSYDLVHIHGVYNINHVLLARFLEKKEIPYIVSLHGGLMEEALKKSKYKKKIALNLLIKRMLKKACSLHALNQQEAIDIKKIISHPSIKVIPNGVDESNVVRQKQDFQEGPLHLLFIGRIDIYHKGLDLLFDALDKSQFKETVKLYLVGPYVSETDQEYVKERIKESVNLKKIVHVEGPKYGLEKEEYYKKSDLFVHTSRHKGMPMAVLEALTAGIPAMVTPGTNMLEVIKRSNGGFTTSFDERTVANTIKTIQEIPKDKLYEMGQEARNWSQRELSWNNIVNSYDSYYKEIIKE